MPFIELTPMMRLQLVQSSRTYFPFVRFKRLKSLSATHLYYWNWKIGESSFLYALLSRKIEGSTEFRFQLCY